MDLSGFVAQLVRALPCHGRGREFEPRRIRHFCCHKTSKSRTRISVFSLGASLVGSAIQKPLGLFLRQKERLGSRPSASVRVSPFPPFLLSHNSINEPEALFCGRIINSIISNDIISQYV